MRNDWVVCLPLNFEIVTSVGWNAFTHHLRSWDLNQLLSRSWDAALDTAAKTYTHKYIYNIDVLRLLSSCGELWALQLYITCSILCRRLALHLSREEGRPAASESWKAAFTLLSITRPHQCKFLPSPMSNALKHKPNLVIWPAFRLRHVQRLFAA